VWLQGYTYLSNYKVCRVAERLAEGSETKAVKGYIWNNPNCLQGFVQDQVKVRAEMNVSRLYWLMSVICDFNKESPYSRITNSPAAFAFVFPYVEANSGVSTHLPFEIGWIDG